MATRNSGNVADEEDTYFEYSVPASELQTGDNLIAVEVHQANDSSSDLSFDLELIASPKQEVTFLLHETGNGPYLLWSGDEDLILQSSDDLSNWTDHPEANSPFPVSRENTDPRKFFRLAW